MRVSMHVSRRSYIRQQVKSPPKFKVCIFFITFFILFNQRGPILFCSSRSRSKAIQYQRAVFTYRSNRRAYKFYYSRSQLSKIFTKSLPP